MRVRGFTPIILILVVVGLVVLVIGGFTVFTKTREAFLFRKSGQYGREAIKSISFDPTNPPKFIQTDFINLDKIDNISKFRSGSGHDYSMNSGETCRSMKHYFNVKRTPEADIFKKNSNGIPPEPDGKTDIDIYSPVDGRIVDIFPEQEIADQIVIEPKGYPGVEVHIFHVYKSQGIIKGKEVRAGEKIGVIGQYQNTDLSIIYNQEGKKTNYISYFEVMPDGVFAQYQSYGIKSRDELIISKEYRDTHPLKCDGEWFTENYDEDRSNFVYLSKTKALN